MILDLLFSIPIWLFGLLLMLTLSAFSVVGLIIVRRKILPKFRIAHEDANFGATITQSVMVFYGLVVALIAVSVWQRYAQIVDIVSAESAAIGAMWRDVSGYPEPERSALRAGLKKYTEFTIDVAWPEQQKGRVMTGGVELMNSLQAVLYAYEPRTEGQKILHLETLRAYNHLIQTRRLRLDVVDTGLPGVLWLVILPGALVSLFSLFFFRVEDLRYHMVMVVLLSMFVAMVIFVVVALDRPFRGDLAITADSYRLIYDTMMR